MLAVVAILVLVVLFFASNGSSDKYTQILSSEERNRKLDIKGLTSYGNQIAYACKLIHATENGYRFRFYGNPDNVQLIIYDGAHLAEIAGRCHPDLRDYMNKCVNGQNLVLTSYVDKDEYYFKWFELHTSYYHFSREYVADTIKGQFVKDLQTDAKGSYITKSYFSEQWMDVEGYISGKTADESYEDVLKHLRSMLSFRCK